MRCFAEAAVEIAASPDGDVLLEQVIARVQAPPIEDLVIAAELAPRYILGDCWQR